MSFGLYIHWPYCARICPYCDFNVYRARGADDGAMVAALIQEIKSHRARLGPRTVETISFGGGTPSLMAPDMVSRIIEAAGVFDIAPDCEISLEANPEDADRLATLIEAGINRLSLGVQALNDSDLKALGRAHTGDQGRACIERAAGLGVRVSADLIYARSGQTLAQWRAELTEALKLPVEHLSLYQLTIEQGTAFDRAARRGVLQTPDSNQAADFYELTQAICDGAGMPAYEVSNHARGPAARSRHNLVYWTHGEWAGIGPGAHGRLEEGGQRLETRAARRPADYLKRVRECGLGWDETSVLTGAEAAEEALMMGLRITEGVSRAKIERLAGRKLDSNRIADLVAAGALVDEPTHLRLTARGRLVADWVAGALLA
jgi:oxygen-independent coproporphyrinogen-3 oxidase